MSVCLYSIYLGFVHVLPALAPDTFGRAWWLHFGTFLYLAANFFYHYLACIVKDPLTHESAAFGPLVDEARGRGLLLPAGAAADSAAEVRGRHRMDGEDLGSTGVESDSADDDELLHEDDRGGWLLRNDPFSWGQCPHSGSPKPPRAHFCKVTGRLVLEMDHYCVWVFNCIGHGNYRHFYLALLWLTVGCLFGLCEAATVYKRAPVWQPTSPMGDGRAEELTFLGLLFQNGIVGPAGPLFFCCLVTAACASVVGPFLGWHTYLTVARGSTTIEYAGAAIRERSGGGSSGEGSYWLGGSACYRPSGWITWCERMGLLQGTYSVAGGNRDGRTDAAVGGVLARLLLLPWRQHRAAAVWSRTSGVNEYWGGSQTKGIFMYRMKK